MQLQEPHPSLWLVLMSLLCALTTYKKWKIFLQHKNNYIRWNVTEVSVWEQIQMAA